MNKTSEQKSNHQIIDKNNTTIQITDEKISEFLNFLDKKEEYLDSGLGAFHTDDHSNW